MKKLLARTLVFLLIAAGLTVLLWPILHRDPVKVTVAVVKRGVVEETVANTRAGTVRARRRSQLAPATGGQVAALPVREGDRVKVGQVLLQLWNEDLRAELVLREAEAERARSLATEAKVRWEFAQRDAERLVELRGRDIASEEQADRAVSEARASKARWEAAEKLVRVREASIATIRAQIEKTVLKAPFAGQVAEVNAELGEFVTPSPTGIPTLPTVDLIDRTSLYVKAPIDEVDAAAVRLGQPVRITLDAFGKRIFPGKVRRIAPYVLDREKQARTVDVEVDFESVDGADGVATLLPGYSADVEIVLRVRDNVLRVTTQAVLQDNRLLVFDPATSTLKARTFEPGARNWRFTEVLSGVAEGEQVVISLDAEGVEDGATVTLGEVANGR
jgi:HlyD family secretion protein